MGGATVSRQEESRQRKKRKRNPSIWKRNISKTAKLKDQQYINYKGQRIPAKITGCAYRCKRFKCFQDISADEKESILVRLHTLTSKDEQDDYIQSLIDIHNVQRRRPRKDNSIRQVDKVYTYHVIVGNTKRRVCYKAFLALLALSDKRVKRLRKLSISDQSPHDEGGKTPSVNALSAEVRQLTTNHINRYPVRESHYSWRTSKYLDARLNIKLIYKMFKEKHTDVKCSNQTYALFINENYSLSFGRPQKIVSIRRVCTEVSVDCCVGYGPLSVTSPTLLCGPVIPGVSAQLGSRRATSISLHHWPVGTFGADNWAAV
ncbi:uncharacterized protein LOC126149510 [Schistocerca cancellata]|uniref:uncharacterized protein LOC126149510 n=1 Tax=Schistocerca cancellata TaxID=274614 RepID=UPI00211848E9|nr:uncharacterized protein LOC126149510 [Schistocerca cancellata]